MNIRVLLICLATLLISCLNVQAQDQQLGISIGCNDGEPGQTRCVTFTVDNAVSQLASLQFEISYDPSVLMYTGIPDIMGTCLDGLQDIQFNDNNNGIISFIWFQTPGIDVAAGCKMFTLCFTIIGEPGEASPITILDNDFIEATSEFGKVNLNFDPCTINVTTSSMQIVKKFCSPSAAGVSDGSVTFYGIGGAAPYSYTFRQGAATLGMGTAGEASPITFNNLPGGNYTIILQDANMQVRNITFFVDSSGKPSFNADIWDPSCFTSDNGKIKLKDINAPVTPYVIRWSNGVFNRDSIQELYNGVYSVTLEDGNGCSVSDSFTLAADTLKAVFEVLDSASCKGLTDGVVRITVSGGTPQAGPQPYQLNISQTSSTNFIPAANPFTWTNAPAGWVKVRVRDYAINFLGNPSPCIIDELIYVPFRNATEFSLINKEDVACFGEATGKIEVKAGGTGVGNSFVMNTYYAGTNTPHPGGISGPMGIHLNNTLEAGDYCIYSKSNIGCKDTFCFTINQPFSKLVVGVEKTEPSCTGPGSIKLNATGGQPGYTFVWQDNAAAQDIRTNLLKGTYIVTVTDAAMCDTIISIVLANAPGTDSINAVVSKAISCNDGSDGALTVNFDGAVPTNATYNWAKSNGTVVGNTRNISGLTWGTYYVTVTADGCVSLDSVILLNPEGLRIVSAEIIAPECPRGGSQGSLGITIQGGAPGYNYSWSLTSNPSQILGNNSVLAPAVPGTYQVKIVDQSGCSIDTTILLPSAPDFTITLFNIIGESCNGQANGKASAIAAGGPVNNGQYKFFWSSGETSGGIFNPHSAQQLTGGKNWVFVTDSKCVSDTVFFDVNSPPAIISSYQATGICAGDCSGRIDVAASGGTGGALTVSWPTIPFTGSAVFNLCAGTYPFLITDGNGCTFRDTVVIAASDTIKLIVDENLTVPLSCKNSSGQLALIVQGGSPIPGTGYTFEWSPNVSQSNIAANLGQGQYNITVTDLNGCTATVSYTMARPNPVVADIATPVPPPCFGGTSCIVVNSVAGGVPGNYTMQINNGLRIPIDSCLQLFAGEYLVSIYDASGCKTDYPVTIAQPPSIDIYLGEDQVLNLGEEITLISPIIQSQFPITSYNWTGIGDLVCIGNPCTELAGTPKSDLTIQLVVTDENGCSAFDELEITVKDERRVYLPNIFQTSGQQVNRRFDIQTGFGVEIVENLTIYDRWGSIVHSQSNYLPDATTGWDGLFRGQQAVPGVYVFVATVRFLDGQVKTYRGDVTLLK